jgi:hypothetical protein
MNVILKSVKWKVIELHGMIEQLAMDTVDIAKYAINDNAANMKLAISESQYLIQYFCDIHIHEDSSF